MEWELNQLDNSHEHKKWQDGACRQTYCVNKTRTRLLEGFSAGLYIVCSARLIADSCALTASGLLRVGECK